MKRSLFIITTNAGNEFYLVAESYADAHELFKKKKQDRQDYYVVKGIKHITEEIDFYPDTSAILHDEKKRLILPDTDNNKEGL